MILYLTLSCGAATLLAVSFYLFSPRITAKKQRPVWKAIASSFFLLVGGCALFSGSAPSAARFLIFGGLLFSFAGDVILDLEASAGFLLGLASFACGHLCYAAGFLLTVLSRAAGEGLTWDGPLLFAASALLLILLFPLLKLKPPKPLLFPVALYLTLLSLTLSLSLPAARAVLSPLPLIAASLFTFSDAALAAGLFGKRSRTADSLCLYTYYPAQLLFAYVITLI